MHDQSKTSLLNLPSAKKLVTKDALQNDTQRNFSKGLGTTGTLNTTSRVKDIHAKKPNPHLEIIKDIIAKVRRMRGPNPTTSNLKAVSETIQRQQLA